MTLFETIYNLGVQITQISGSSDTVEIVLPRKVYVMLWLDISASLIYGEDKCTFGSDILIRGHGCDIKVKTALESKGGEGMSYNIFMDPEISNAERHQAFKTWNIICLRMNMSLPEIYRDLPPEERWRRKETYDEIILALILVDRLKNMETKL